MATKNKTDYLAEQVERIVRDGHAVIHKAVGKDQCELVLQEFQSEVQSDFTSTSRGTIFAARNLLETFRPARTIWRQPLLLELLLQILGPDAGLVRVLYFDKPSNRSWALPWHKDMTVAVKDNSIETMHFSKPTCKAGVDHLEAPTELLNNMLTLRLHLDAVTDQNGPLRVIPGSHLNGKAAATTNQDFATIHANIGDVLAMRPLISHSSGHADQTAGLNRRILHFEFSGTRCLPDAVEWHSFVPLKSTAQKC